jgi:hypothetical protein
LWVTWENGPGFGLGARIKCMLAFFAIAVRENRILVSDSFGRADHPACLGLSSISFPFRGPGSVVGFTLRWPRGARHGSKMPDSSVS